MSATSLRHPSVSLRRGADRRQTRIGWLHQDSEGHTGVIYPNLAQRMTAGTGIRHSEKNDWTAVNPDAGQPLHVAG